MIYFWAMQNVPGSEDAGNLRPAAFAKKLVFPKVFQNDPSWSRYQNLA